MHPLGTSMAQRHDKTEPKDAASTAANFARDELLGARHWKESKLGYLTGFSSIKESMGVLSGTARESTGRIRGLYGAAFSQDKSGRAVSEDGTDRDRFIAAMAANGRTIQDVDHSVVTTFRQFHFYAFLALVVLVVGVGCLVHYGLAPTGNTLVNVIIGTARFAPLMVLLPLMLRAGWTNFSFRRRRLVTVLDYLRSSNRMPRRPPAKEAPAVTGRAAVRGVKTRSLAFWALAGATGWLCLMAGTVPSVAQTTPATIFTDPNSGDMFMRLMAYVIPDTGPVGTPKEGVQQMHTATKSAFTAFSGVLLFIGMSIAGWHILSGLVASAKEGTALGRNYHEVWAPARVVVGFGMLTPVAGGICGAQLLVLYLIAWGGNLANAVYQPYIDSMTVQTIPVSAQAAQDTVTVGNLELSTKAVKTIAEKELCSLSLALVEQRGAGANGGAVQTSPTWKPVTSEDTSLQNDLGLAGGSVLSLASVAQQIDYGPVCGQITVNSGVQNSQGAQGTVSQIEADRFQAVQTMQQAIRTALTPAVQTYQPSQSSGQKQAFVDDTNTGLMDTFKQARATYSKMIAASVAKAYQANNPTGSSDIQSTANDAKTNGWATAGVFYLTMARLQNAVYSAATEGLSATQIRSEGQGTDSEAYRRALVGSDGAGIMPAFNAWWERNIDKMVPDISARGTSAVKSTTSFGDVLSAMFAGIVKLWSYTSDSVLALNPMQAMIDFGNRLMLWGAGYYLAGATMAGSAGGLVARAASGAASLTGIGVLAEGLREAASGLGTLGMMLSLGMIAAGALHAYIIPLIPYIMTVFFVASMLVLVVESLVAAPIWAFVHIRMDGQEFVDQVQRPGYMIAFNLILRPALMIFGLILSYLVFGAMMWFIAKTFIPVVSALSASTSVGPIGTLVLIAVQSYLDYQIAIRSFQLILQVPDRVTRWFGQGGENLGEDHESNRLTGVVAGQIVNRVEGLSRAQQLGKNRGGAPGGAAKSIADDATGANATGGGEGGGGGGDTPGGKGKPGGEQKKPSNNDDGQPKAGSQ